jgi:hypothetical protein
MATVLDIIQGALLNLNSYAPGEPLDANTTNVGLGLLNDLFDSYSTDRDFVWSQNETVFTWTAGKYQYSVGNYTGGTFTGNLSLGSPTISGATIPSTLAVGGTLTGLSAAIPAGTTVVSFGAGSVTMSANATANVTLDQITYTIPGDIPIQRPLRFRNGYTRATTSGNSNLDFYFEFKSYEEYKRELLKNIPGPWPYIAAYRPDFPLGQLFVYPSPGANYTAHLFSDLILQSATNTSAVFSMPQGYTRAFKKLLALEFAPVLMKPVSNELRRQAKEAKDLIKALNAAPVEPLQYDTAISRASSNDAGWIVGGGFV